MEKENKNTEAWLNLSLSQKLVGRDMTVINKNVAELKNSVSEFAPNGRLVVFISSEREKFSPIEKVVSNLALAGKIYNQSNFMRDPSVAVEFSEIAEHINAINKIMDKRKKRGGKKHGK